MVTAEATVWKQFHQHWLAQDVDTIMVRYEDLVAHREHTLRRIFRFTTGLPTLSGTRWEQSIVANAQVQLAKAGPYKPRSGKICASLRHFSPEQKQRVVDICGPLLEHFG
jgi:hypothetical protein